MKKRGSAEMVTAHAQTNAERYLTPEYTNKRDALKFQAAVAMAMQQNDSTAIILKIKTTDNAHRDNWAMNDRLVGIVRHHDLVTVMLSRKNQINRKHLRTEAVYYV